MRTLKVQFIKRPKIMTAQPEFVELMEQVIHVYGIEKKVDIPVPPGYSILTITELMPDLKLNSNDNGKTDGKTLQTL